MFSMLSSIKIFLKKFASSAIDSLRESAQWALRRIWGIHASLTIGIIVTTLIRSLTPAGLILMARGLINAVATSLESGNSHCALLLPWLLFGMILSLLEAFSRITYTFFTQRLHDELNLEITSAVLTQASKLDVSFFEDPRFQNILQRAQQNPSTHLGEFITDALSTITNLIQLVSLVVILIAIAPLLTLTLFVLGMPYLLFQWRFTRTRHAWQHARATQYRWTGYFTSLLTGQRSIPEIKLLDLGPLLIAKFRTLMSKFRDQDRTLYRQSLIGGVIFYSISTAAFYMTFGWIALMALKGNMTLGDVAVYGGITMRLSLAIENTILSATHALEHTLYISNVMEFLNLTPSISPNGGIMLKSVQGMIELRDVCFTYPGSSRPVLSGISLSIQPGETIALVGENGAGKTTLVKLIARLYDPDRGEILFDGVDLKQLSLSYLHAHISFVLQDFGQYEASAYDNIAYGNWRNLLNDKDKIEQIAHRAEVHAMITKFPQGYETLLGRMFGEYTLSGGQWQQLALARAFARDAKLLILDEPTSNLDARSEYNIFCRFRELTEGRTTILISHRFSTVSIAERILVMDQGHIVESGSHQELLAQKGYYANLYNLHQSQMMNESV